MLSSVSVFIPSPAVYENTLFFAFSPALHNFKFLFFENLNGGIVSCFNRHFSHYYDIKLFFTYILSILIILYVSIRSYVRSVTRILMCNLSEIYHFLSHSFFPPWKQPLPTLLAVYFGVYIYILNNIWFNLLH